MLDKDLKIKLSLFQKLRDNNLYSARQIKSITYEQGKKLNLTKEEDEILTKLCMHLADKKSSELEFIIKKQDEEV